MNIDIKKIKNFIKIKNISYDAYFRKVKGFCLTFGNKTIECKYINNIIINKKNLYINIK